MDKTGTLSTECLVHFQAECLVHFRAECPVHFPRNRQIYDNGAKMVIIINAQLVH